MERSEAQAPLKRPRLQGLQQHDEREDWLDKAQIAEQDQLDAVHCKLRAEQQARLDAKLSEERRKRAAQREAEDRKAEAETKEVLARMEELERRDRERQQRHQEELRRNERIRLAKQKAEDEARKAEQEAEVETSPAEEDGSDSSPLTIVVSPGQDSESLEGMYSPDEASASPVIQEDEPPRQPAQLSRQQIRAFRPAQPSNTPLTPAPETKCKAEVQDRKPALKAPQVLQATPKNSQATQAAAQTLQAAQGALGVRSFEEARAALSSLAVPQSWADKKAIPSVAVRLCGGLAHKRLSIAQVLGLMQADFAKSTMQQHRKSLFLLLNDLCMRLTPLVHQHQELPPAVQQFLVAISAGELEERERWWYSERLRWIADGKPSAIWDLQQAEEWQKALQKWRSLMLAGRDDDAETPTQPQQQQQLPPPSQQQLQHPKQETQQPQPNKPEMPTQQPQPNTPEMLTQQPQPNTPEMLRQQPQPKTPEMPTQQPQPQTPETLLRQQQGHQQQQQQQRQQVQARPPTTHVLEQQQALMPVKAEKEEPPAMPAAPREERLRQSPAKLLLPPRPAAVQLRVKAELQDQDHAAASSSSSSLRQAAEEARACPEPWKPCQTEDGELFYFNLETGDTVWDHPCDVYPKSAHQERSGQDCQQDLVSKVVGISSTTLAQRLSHLLEAVPQTLAQDHPCQPAQPIKAEQLQQQRRPRPPWREVKNEPQLQTEDEDEEEPSSHVCGASQQAQFMAQPVEPPTGSEQAWAASLRMQFMAEPVGPETERLQARGSVAPLLAPPEAAPSKSMWQALTASRQARCMAEPVVPSSAATEHTAAVATALTASREALAASRQAGSPSSATTAQVPKKLLPRPPWQNAARSLPPSPSGARQLPAPRRPLSPTRPPPRRALPQPRRQANG